MLVDLAQGDDPAQAQAARAHLEALVDDDSRTISRAARQALERLSPVVEVSPAESIDFDVLSAELKEMIDDGDVDETLERINTLLDEGVEHPVLYMRRGYACGEQNQYEQAIIDFTSAIALDPQYGTAYHNRGVTYDKQGQLEEALTDYDLAIKLDPQYAAAYNNRGIVYYHQGEYEQAIADWE